MGCGTAHHPHKQIALLHLASLCDKEAWELTKEEKDRHTSWCPSVHGFWVRRGGNLGFGSSLSSVLSWSAVKCTSMIWSDAELIHPEWLTLLRMFLSCRLTRSTREAAKFVSNAINWKTNHSELIKSSFCQEIWLCGSAGMAALGVPHHR